MLSWLDKVILIRLLIDAYDAPIKDELAVGLTNSKAGVTCPGPETAGHYPEFRRKLQRLLDPPLLDSSQRATMAWGSPGSIHFIDSPRV